MDAERPTVTLHQDLEVSPCLCRLHHPKGILAPRDRHTSSIVTGALQKHTTVRATLIRLPGRVQEAWPIPQTRRHFLAIAYCLAHSLQWLLMCVVHLDVSRDAEIISHSQAVQVRLQIGRQRFYTPGSTGERCGILIIREEFDAIRLEHGGLR